MQKLKATASAKPLPRKHPIQDLVVGNDALARMIDRMLPIAREGLELQYKIRDALQAGDETTAIVLMKEYLNLEGK